MNTNRTQTARWLAQDDTPRERLTGEHETAGLMIHSEDDSTIELGDDGLPSALGTFGTLQNKHESEIFSKIAEAALAAPSRYERPTLLRRVLFIMGF